MSLYNLRLVPQEEITRPFLWGLIDLFQEAIKYNYGEKNVDEYIDLLMEGAYQLWVDEHQYSKIARGIGVTVLVKEPHVTYVRVLLYSNEGTASYLEQAESFEDWCLRFGASEVEFWGREGWKRALKPLGYELKYLVMRKPLRG